MAKTKTVIFLAFSLDNGKKEAWEEISLERKSFFKMPPLNLEEIEIEGLSYLGKQLADMATYDEAQNLKNHLESVFKDFMPSPLRFSFLPLPSYDSK